MPVSKDRLVLNRRAQTANFTEVMGTANEPWASSLVATNFASSITKFRGVTAESLAGIAVREDVVRRA